MTTILKRLYNIAKTYRINKSELSNNFSQKKETDVPNQSDEFQSEPFSRTFTTNDFENEEFHDYSSQIVEDLANFNLRPPSSLSEVRKARNKEIKKYHPDRFMDDSQRLETAKEIMQIYNASWERLKKFYENRSD